MAIKFHFPTRYSPTGDDNTGFKISSRKASNKPVGPKLAFGATAAPTAASALGLSKTAQNRLYFMVILLGVLVIFIAGDLGHLFLKTRDNMQPATTPKWGVIDNTGTTSTDRSSWRMVKDDPTIDGAVPGLELPSTRAAVAADNGDAGDPDTSVATTTADDGENNAGDDSTPTPTPTPTDPGFPRPPDPDADLREMREAQRRRIEAAEAEMAHKPRPRDIPSTILDSVGTSITDIRSNDFGELHKELLRIVHQVPAEQLAAVAWLPGEANYEKWFRLREGEPEVKAFIGRAFTVEATINTLQRVPAAVFNVEDVEIVDGRPTDHVWRGILTFGYDFSTYTTGGMLITERNYAMVQFTTLGPLPEGLTPERVIDDTQRPIRVRATGLFFHHRPAAVTATDERSLPHLVFGPMESIDSLPVEVDRDLLARVQDESDDDRRNPKPAAIQSLLYVLKHHPNPAEFEKSVDPSITYGDLFNQPHVYRQKPTVVRFYGQVGQIGTTENPIEEYGPDTDLPLLPNPYGIRRQYIAAITVLDENHRQQNLICDVVHLELWDPKTRTHYNYREALKTGKTPSGDPLPKPAFRRGDTVEITGYMLYKFRYQGKDEKWHDVPRLVVRAVRQLPPHESEATPVVFLLGVVFVVILLVVFFLFRREQDEADTFRKEFIKKHVGQLRPHARVANKSAAATAPSPAPNAATPPASDAATAAPDAASPPAPASADSTPPAPDAPAPASQASAEASSAEPPGVADSGDSTTTTPPSGS